MKIQYLGTAAAEGWPGLFCHCERCDLARKIKGKEVRSRSQVLINENLLVDFGPDTYYHALTQDVDFVKIETVLLTHSHCDHFYPTELILRAVPYAYGLDKNKMSLYGNQKCQDKFEQMLLQEDDAENVKACVVFHQIDTFHSFSASGYQIQSLKASHDPRENCLLYSIYDSEGKRLFYGNDTGPLPEETWEQIKDLYFDVVSLDCTMGGTPGCNSHMGIEENRQTRERMLELGCADHNTIFVMTHFSHNGCLMHEELTARAKEIGFLAAYDGMILEV
jgi:phosphoribosyl 1,2-cyclic phosphate phosphodiesterase